MELCIDQVFMYMYIIYVYILYIYMHKEQHLDCQQNQTFELDICRSLNSMQNHGEHVPSGLLHCCRLLSMAELDAGPYFGQLY